VADRVGASAGLGTSVFGILDSGVPQDVLQIPLSTARRFVRGKLATSMIQTAAYVKKA